VFEPSLGVVEKRADTMSRLAVIDPLTQTLNRRGITAALLESMAFSERYHHPLAIALVDIDHFKQVNDRFGHEAGDRALEDLVAISWTLFASRIAWDVTAVRSTESTTGLPVRARRAPADPVAKDNEGAQNWSRLEDDGQPQPDPRHGGAGGLAAPGWSEPAPKRLVGESFPSRKRFDQSRVDRACPSLTWVYKRDKKYSLCNYLTGFSPFPPRQWNGWVLLHLVGGHGAYQ
jgi:hypothetical protein